MKNDPELRKLLHCWEVNVAPDPGFEAAVWRRIAVEDEQRLHRRWTNRFRDWLELQLPRPVYASTLLVAAIMLGASAAVFRLDIEADAQRTVAARQYFTSIDPLQMAFPK